jgi:hypothetical protein
MSNDNQQALNDAGAAPASAAAPAAPLEFGDGLVSTTEFSNDATTPAPSDATSPDGGAKPEGQDAAATGDTTGDAAAKTQSDASSDADDVSGGRLDRDSRFQQVIKSNRHLKNQLQDLTAKHDEVLSRLEKLSTGQEQPMAGDADAGKVLGMSEEELLDLQATNPAKYHQMLVDSLTKQITDTVSQSVTKATDQRSYEESVGKTFEAYAKEHPDFDDMWDSGDLKRYMDSHPGHNAISAHMAMTSEARTKAAVDAAVKKATDKMRNDLRTKGRAAVLGTGPSGQIDRQGAAGQELADSKKFGGQYAVLARRSAARRAQ